MDDDEEASRRTFELLANETRLGIISTLGEASGEGGYATLAFSDLQAATGVEDNGHFNYHLTKLVGEFIEEREGGYALTLAGIRAYQAIVAYRVTPEVEIEPFEFPHKESCVQCGGTIVARYTDGRFITECEECGTEELNYPVSVADFDPNDPESLLDAATRRMIRDESSMYNGVCPYCAGRVVWTVELPEGHWEESNLRGDAMAHGACTRCAWFLYGNVVGKIRHHPAISDFLSRHGYDPWTDPPWEEQYDFDHQVLDDDPVRVEVSYLADGECLEVTVDSDLVVLNYDIRLIEE
ncbi:hypothetical protein GRX01_08400 [Halobaculum sp. WSA2]|uniref:Uncharacterized protein n=1 Tax=Halobaculum saliterrae TaxID=2073113 RepID=A0A6B0SS46_9EURY|nr:helix-turn-helix domain-containing protein [Halobaculum saliterrae]MXR41357.1 hypothetical protein [Halobaculum saliterrae]